MIFQSGAHQKCSTHFSVPEDLIFGYPTLDPSLHMMSYESLLYTHLVSVDLHIPNYRAKTLFELPLINCFLNFCCTEKIPKRNFINIIVAVL